MEEQLKEALKHTDNVEDLLQQRNSQLSELRQQLIRAQALQAQLSGADSTSVDLIDADPQASVAALAAMQQVENQIDQLQTQIKDRDKEIKALKKGLSTVEIEALKSGLSTVQPSHEHDSAALKDAATRVKEAEACAKEASRRAKTADERVDRLQRRLEEYQTAESMRTPSGKHAQAAEKRSQAAEKVADQLQEELSALRIQAEETEAAKAEVCELYEEVQLDNEALRQVNEELTVQVSAHGCLTLVSVTTTHLATPPPPL